MAVLHHRARPAGAGVRIRTPEDLGLGLAVSAVLAVGVGVLLLAASALDGQGPRGEAHAPFDQAVVSWFESAAPVPPLLPER